MSEPNVSFLSRFLWQVGGQDPRYRNFLLAAGLTEMVDSKRTTLYDQLLAIHGVRLKRYRDFWNLYYGNHAYEISEENLDPLKVNYCGITVNKNTAFLMNKGFQVSSQFPDVQSFLNRNWALNKGGNDINLFGTNLALHGGVTGDSFFNVEVAQHPLTEDNYIKYRLLDGLKSFPVYDRMDLIGFLYYGLEQIVDYENYGFTQYSRSYEGFYYSANGYKNYLTEEKSTGKSEVSINEVPVLHIKNFPAPIFNYGISDLASIAEINLTFDRILTDVQDIIDYHSAPITILKGAKATELTRGANRVWAIPKEADISNLKLEGELSATVDHMRRLREHIAEQTNIPETSVGKQQAISNTSASALAITFMPLYETMEFKRTTYGCKLIEANTMTLKYAYLSGMLSPKKIIEKALATWQKTYADLPDDERQEFYPFSKPIDPSIDYDSFSAYVNKQLPEELYQTAITWFPPLPRDEDSQTTTLIAGISSNLWSREYARADLGISPKTSAQIDKEIEEEMTKFGNDNGQVVTNAKTGMEGNNNVKGEKESQRSQAQSANSTSDAVTKSI